MKLLYLHTESGGSYRIPGKHMDIKEEIMRYLTIALAKGRLALKAMDMFEQIGISCEEMKDKNSRKLIFVNEDLGIPFLFSQGK